jgi:hypothetical protein
MADDGVREQQPAPPPPAPQSFAASALGCLVLSGASLTAGSLIQLAAFIASSQSQSLTHLDISSNAITSDCSTYGRLVHPEWMSALPVNYKVKKNAPVVRTVKPCACWTYSDLTPC